MDFVVKIKLALITVFTVISGWLGALVTPFYILVSINIIDYITGVYAARCRGEKVSSNVGFRGIAKKICMWLLVLVGFVVDYIILTLTTTLNIDVGVAHIVATAVIFWLMANELISILENIADIGVKVPWLLKIVELIKEKTEEAVDIDAKEG